MAIILTEILDTSLDDIHKLPIPAIFFGNGIKRLRRIIYTARYYLSERSAAEIKQAATDILSLYQWFFDKQAGIIASEIQYQIEKNMTENLLHEYVDTDKYIYDKTQSIKQAYLSEIDVLISLLHEPQGIILNQIECVRTDFSNIEFFCVSALYQSSIAIIKARETKVLIEKMEIQPDLIVPVSIEGVYDAILDAQYAIDYAHQIGLSGLSESPETSNFIQSYIRDNHRALMRKAHETRYGTKYQQRKTKAIELYQEGSYRSRFDAALHLIDPIQEYSRQLGIQCLKFDSAQDTIYKWLSEYDKNKEKKS